MYTCWIVYGMVEKTYHLTVASFVNMCISVMLVRIDFRN